MPSTENPYAGQGPVLLDIGGDVGALIVRMPASMEGVEVEIRPRGATAAAAHRESPGHDPGTRPSHAPGHGRTHYPHVAVVRRPDGSGSTYTLVYADVTEGDYELVPLFDGAVRLRATVTGGSVTHATWPG